MTKARKTRTSQQAESTSREEISLHDSEDERSVTTMTKRSILIKTAAGDLGDQPLATSSPASKESHSSFRSINPLTISRNEEKEELAHLNDRFAYYIDYVRSLEVTKEKLTKKIQKISKSETVEMDKIKKLYDDELISLRKMADELAKDCANLEIDLKNSDDRNNSLEKRLERRDSEVNNLQRKVEELERELTKNRFDSDKYGQLLSIKDVLEKKCAKISKDLDAEILLRTDLENKNVTLKEQMEFNEKLHKEETKKLHKSQIIIEEEIEDRKNVEYESKLAEELRAIREETAEEFETYKMEFEQSFVLRLEELRKTNQQTNESAVKSRDEMLMWRAKAEKFDQELSGKLAEIELLKKRLKDIESLLNYERNEFEEQLKHFREESEELRNDLQKRLDDFSNLMSTKIALDQEILMYRKLLEGEEARCNISAAPDSDSSFSILNTGSKRRKVGEHGEFISTDGGKGNSISYGRESYKVDHATIGNVEFSSRPDCTGRFVKFSNLTDKDLFIGGWTLRYVADNQETSYKFHHNLHIKSKSDCTVWSSDANETHNPPSDLVMKNQRFFSGLNIKMTLTNTDNKEEASCVLNKERLRTSMLNYNRKIAARRTTEDRKCVIM